MKICTVVLLACGVTQAAAEPNSAPVSSIRVMGEGLITTSPDRAQIDVGVLTQAQHSQPAAAQNAKQLDAVLNALRKLLGPGADIKTINYSLNPNYQYHPDGAQPTITGYTATNVVRITLDDLPKMGAVIDTATAAGANNVQSVQFTVRDPQRVRAQALREAALAARAEAEALASALSLKIIRVLAVEEEGVPRVPMNQITVASARKLTESEPTPIQPGSIGVNANVTLTVEVAPR
jgi:uncharacterized protein YggE